MLGRGASRVGMSPPSLHPGVRPPSLFLSLFVVVLVLFVGRGGSPSASNSPELVRSNVHAHNAVYLSRHDTGFASTCTMRRGRLRSLVTNVPRLRTIRLIEAADRVQLFSRIGRRWLSLEGGNGRVDTGGGTGVFLFYFAR